MDVQAVHHACQELPLLILAGLRRCVWRWEREVDVQHAVRHVQAETLGEVEHSSESTSVLRQGATKAALGGEAVGELALRGAGLPLDAARHPGRCNHQLFVTERPRARQALFPALRLGSELSRLPAQHATPGGH